MVPESLEDIATVIFSTANVYVSGNRIRDAPSYYQLVVTA